jgi:hypothetical protein
MEAKDAVGEANFVRSFMEKVLVVLLVVGGVKVQRDPLIDPDKIDKLLKQAKIRRWEEKFIQNVFESRNRKIQVKKKLMNFE